MNPDTIKEFLVALGFRVDEQGFKRFNENIDRATRGVFTLGTAAMKAASAVVSAVVIISDKYEELVYASIRAEASIRTLRAFEYAAQQIGLAVGKGRGALEAFSMAMRINPGLKGVLETTLGIRTAGRDVGDVFTDLIRKLKDMSDAGEFYKAAQIAQLFGIDAATLRLWTENLDRFERRRKQYAESVRDAGVDMERLGKSSVELQNAIDRLWAKIGLLGDQLAQKWIGPVTEAVKKTGEWADELLRLGKATEGWSTTVLALLGGIAAWKAPRWLLWMMGLAGAPAGGGVAAALLRWLGPLGAFLGVMSPQPAGPPAGTREGSMDPGGVARERRFREGGYPATREGMERFEQDEAARAARTAGTPSADTGVTSGRNATRIAASRRARVNRAMAYYMARGWSRAQAAGIVANLYGESGMRHGAVGDGGLAYGLAQWHPDRQAAFKQWAGKDISESTFEEQLAFVHHELTAGNEQTAGRRLRGATTPQQAAAIVTTDYERPANPIGESISRGVLAARLSAADASRAGRDMAPTHGIPYLQAPGLPAALTSTTSVNQNTTINVDGSGDPADVADRVSNAQRRVNGDLVRNLRAGAVQ